MDVYAYMTRHAPPAQLPHGRFPLGGGAVSGISLRTGTPFGSGAGCFLASGELSAFAGAGLGLAAGFGPQHPPDFLGFSAVSLGAPGFAAGAFFGPQAMVFDGVVPVLCVDTCLLYTSPSPRDS
eukprot:TRINITY_DN194_c0_g1_i2.p2 TRINITY_DN194_c0_g1~~TRINITY_DN194_c0_g1_i2.p2  ORF type:complete len:124 (+),score=12.81 TRINITY_DN194_c0_g1_i2:465-836(+)